MNRHTQLIVTLYFFNSLLNASEQPHSNIPPKSALTYANTIGQLHQAYLASSMRPATLIVTPQNLAICQQPITPHHNNSRTHKQRRARSNPFDFRAAFVAHTHRTIKIPENLISCLVSIPNEELNAYNIQSGHKLAHELTPVHWLPTVIETAIQRGVDITAQTIAPDRYIGSTLAHNIAGLLYRRNKDPKSNPEHSASALRCLQQLWAVDNGAHFNKESQVARAEACTVWDLLYQSGHLNKFLEPLPNHQQVPTKYLLLYQEHWLSKQKTDNQ